MQRFDALWSSAVISSCVASEDHERLVISPPFVAVLIILVPSSKL